MSDVIELTDVVFTDRRATVCLTCYRAWDDTVSTSRTPVPAGRCPFEDEHEDEDYL
jgi:hypothetical protein